MANGISISNSGLNTDDMVSAAVATYQNKYDNLYKKITEEQWKKEAYVDVYDDIKDYRNEVYNYKLQANTTARTASTSNTSVVTATANADAIEMSHDIVVKSLASNAYLQSKTEVTETDLAKLAGITDTSLLTSGNTDTAISFTLGDGSSTKTISYTYADLAAGKTLNDLASDIKKSGLNITASYDSTNKSFTMFNKSTGESNGISITSTTATDEQRTAYDNAVTAQATAQTAYDTAAAAVTVPDGKTLDEMLTEYNAAKTTDTNNGNTDAVTALGWDSDTLSKMETLSTKAADLTAAASATATAASALTPTDTMFSALHLASYDSASGSLTDVSTSDLASGVMGTNANIVVDGKDMSKDSNSIYIAGVTYQLTGISTQNASGDYEKTSVSISNDTDSLVEIVQNFIDSYNKILDSLNDTVHETTYSTYGALTSDEESAMTETQLSQWYDKAKSGLLRHDSITQKIIDNMRSAITNKIEGLSGNYNTAASIGISASGSWDEYGHLYLDTDKLKKAIAEDPDVVYKIMGTDGASSENDGIATRLYDSLKTGMTTISDQAGTSADDDDQSYIGNRIVSWNDNLDALLDILNEKEDYYYKKYSSMETLIGNLQNSLSTVTSMLG